MKKFVFVTRYFTTLLLVTLVSVLSSSVTSFACSASSHTVAPRTAYFFQHFLNMRV